MQTRTQSLHELASKEKALVEARREATEEQTRIVQRLAELRGHASEGDSVDAMPSMLSLPSQLPSMEGT